ncbi:MAG: M48 family metalloprotease [Planctomycetota bacterium]
MGVLRCGMVLLALSGLAGCSYNPATDRNQLILISPEETMAMGEEAMPELIEEYGGEVPSEELRAYVTDVGTGLTDHVESRYEETPWEFTVLDSEVINAFALPGGKVFISQGLLARFENEAQLAGVLGHEIGHVTARHVDERISQALALELGLSGLGAATESQLLLLSVQLFANGYQLSFGRDQESEADELGVKYMTRAMYDPQGMLQVLEVLRQAAAGASTPEFLSTHPHPETRLKTVTGLIRGPYAFTQDNSEFRLWRDRFQDRATPYLPTISLGAFGQGRPAGWCAICREKSAPPTDEHR